MTEGYWINFKMGAHGKVVKIQEHETDIRNPTIYKKLGIDDATAKTFSQYKVGKDRDKFMTMLMEKFPLIRVRGHGNGTTFEYAHWGRGAAVDAILNFAENVLGDFSVLTINNLATGESKTSSLSELREAYEEKGAEGIMRKGSDIEDELVKISKVVNKVKTSKKDGQQKAMEQVRKSWGFNPRTRVKPSDKKYKRNKSKEIPRD